MKRKKILIDPPTGVFRLFSRKLVILAGLIALAFCLAFTACDEALEGNKGDIVLTGISLDRTRLDLPLGDYDLLIATIQPSNATHQDIRWTADDSITVKNGIITTSASSPPQPDNLFNVKVTTVYGDKDNKTLSANCSVTVKGTPTGTQVAEVSLNKDEIILTQGAIETITARVLPAEAKNKAVFWVSDDPNVVKVDQDGKITAVSEGPATITVYTKNKGKTASCDVIVNAPAATVINVTGVTINPTTLAMNVGDSETFEASVEPTNAFNKGITWRSSAPSIAKVESDGTVTAVANGSATITVTTEDGNFSATCAVTVTTGVAVTGVTLNKTSTSMAIGGSEILIATVLPNNAANKNVTWTSSAPTIAAVTATAGFGNVSALAAGTATITVTTESGNFTASCTVTVADPTNQAAYYGTYTGDYTNKDNKKITETITLSSNSFRIEDNDKSGPNLEFLDFTISTWVADTTPDSHKTDYPTAFKITGKITGANPSDTTILYGNTAASGFTSSDINNTECWMYLYFSSKGTFIRTPFSKSGKDNGTKPVATNTNSALRVYKK